MNKLLITSLFLLIFTLSGCGASKDKNTSEKINKQGKATSEENVKVESKLLKTYLESAWLNPLPEYTWNDIEESSDKLTYNFREEDGVKKQVSYTKTDTSDFKGSMKIVLSKTKDSYIANIPKAFASHIDSLNFSIEPSKIINPDPIVEFENIEGEVVIDSTENKKEDEIEKSLEEQIIDTEASECEKLTGKDALACALSLVSKYRDSEYIQKELSTLPMNDILGASAQAVSTKNLDYCKKFIDSRDKQILCYEHSFQILVKECDAFKGKAYRNCVRDTSKKLPTLQEQRLFCGYIKNEEMRAECQGTAKLESCNEIGDEEERNMCKLNILRTNNVLADCDKIGNKDFQEMCIAIIGADREDASICMKVNDDYIKGQCLTKVAMVNGDKELCSSIDDDKSRSLCNGFFLMKGEATEEMCANENELWLKEMCQMVIAIKNNDIGKCSDPELVGKDNQFLCFLGIAVRHNDASLCSKIDISVGEYEDERKAKEKLRDACYHQIGINTKDSKLCEKIIDIQKKEECKQKLEEKDIPRMTCADVTSAICPMKSSGRGGTKHLDVDGHDVQCTYYTSKEAGYPLYNEMFKLGKIRDGSYKQYYKSGNIKVFSEHKNGKNEGFRIECSDTGKLTQCWFYTPPGKKNIDCMP